MIQQRTSLPPYGGRSPQWDNERGNKYLCGTERRALKEALRRGTSEYVSPLQMSGLRKIESTEVNMALGD